MLTGIQKDMTTLNNAIVLLCECRTYFETAGPGHGPSYPRLVHSSDCQDRHDAFSRILAIVDREAARR